MMQCVEDLSFTMRTYCSLDFAEFYSFNSASIRPQLVFNASQMETQRRSVFLILRLEFAASKIIYQWQIIIYQNYVTYLMLR